MTEDEAKKRWCPFSRYAYANSASGNREMEGYPLAIEATRCIGSLCMAWRWREVVRTQGQDVPMPQGNPAGFCGLAGKP